jgi:Protein of unknown function (DUF4232)
MRILTGAELLGTTLALGATVLTGCSTHATATASTGPAPPAAAEVPAAAGVPRCTSGGLTGLLVAGSPGAGQRYATLALTNTTRQACATRGYGGLQLVASDGSVLPTHQVRDPAPPPETVLVRPEATVTSLLHWSAVPGTGDDPTGNCQPVPATLRVIPPDGTTALVVPWPFGPVCERGRIDQQAYAG